MEHTKLSPLTLMSDQEGISPYMQYQHNIKQTSNYNREKYRFGDYWLIQYQILQSNILRIV